MSGEGPESIPTSADPRSRRPTKKRALTPVSAQAASVDALFARPDQEIRIPNGEKRGPFRAAPPEIVANVQGSSAGAGSGEFHVYKAARRREYERIKEMNEEVRQERAQSEFEKQKEERLRKDEEKTRKNRAKREKLKARKATKGKGAAEPKEKNGHGLSTTEPEHVASSTETNSLTAIPNDEEEVGKANANGKLVTVAEANGLVIHDED